MSLYSRENTYVELSFFFSCVIFKYTFFYRTPPVDTSEHIWKKAFQKLEKVGLNLFKGSLSSIDSEFVLEYFVGDVNKRLALTEL